MSEKVCDHTSVGMIVFNEDREILLIERKKPPFGWAAPAGHVDGDPSFEEATVRELREEVGLRALSCTLMLDEKINNPCRRVDGSWHHWKVYKMNTTGEIEQSEDEVKTYHWTDAGILRHLLEKTQRYENKEMTEQEWEADPGLEPVWKHIFDKIGISLMIEGEEEK
ncbi:MAG: NUDIX hydrolase [Candidatus Nomurabacteria bacterium]|jgi:ADP-ribose pyrophosphatase YjhB (NUDIX family)|nr:NUDIX hydrolase [Candidatus Nomurabacteria bacterium]